ncbi:tripartite tricarboxylate transporter substrate binding protein [Limnohabitans sp.]|uniref:Bug family tripartite tricarboxylate transporter substrate binding protein n=1 Tax=Limnohabitans sp. TaxID=1907725 RepID=UPI00286EE373|nr:tripartite tricarboxylate transporter substrate binding protein [Limnohabitans sp.]
MMNNPSRRQWLTHAAIALMSLCLGTSANAQTYPSKPIKLIVPYAPGGATDIIARTLAEKLSDRLGQPVLIDNRAGAGGVTGTDAVAKAAPDGYTFLVTLGTTVLINQFLYEKLPYTPGRDFSLLSQLALAPVTLLVNPNSGINNANDLKAHVLKNPNKLSYGSWGMGSYAHLAGAYLSQSLNADLTHAAYKGEAPMLQDLVGGQIDFAFASAKTAKPYIDSGKLRSIAVTGEQRMSVLPTIATMREQGFKDDIFRVTGWIAMAAPAKTPSELMQRVSAEVRAIVALPETQERINKMGFIPVGNTPEQFSVIYKSEFLVWERVVKLSGAKLD